MTKTPAHPRNTFQASVQPCQIGVTDKTCTNLITTTKTEKTLVKKRKKSD